jgi:hypothetical protein
MKRCCRCTIEKQETEFFRSKKATDGLHSWCKTCCRNRNKERKINDPSYKEIIKSAYNRYSKTQKAKEKSRRNHKNNYESEKEYGRLYYHKHKEERIKNTNKWRQNNKDKVRANAKASYQRMLCNPTRAFANRIRHGIRKALYKRNIVKRSKTFDILGYPVLVLTDHLKQWLNSPCVVCGQTVITVEQSHIDHIIPLCSANTEEDVIRLNQLDNLRLICAKCNFKKGSRYEFNT